MTEDLEARLVRVKARVQSATREALRKQQLVDWIDNDENDDADSQVNSKNTNKASFHLGMELFGQDVANMEKAIQQNLTNIENELKEINNLLQKQQQQMPANDAAPLNNEVLKIKIQFLKHCSVARAHLDDSTFTDPEQLVAAAQALNQAKEAIENAYAILDQHQPSSSSSADGDASSAEAFTKIFSKAYEILDDLESAHRRQKIEIVSKAMKLFHNEYVEINAISISVRKTPHLATVYEVLEILDETKWRGLLHKFAHTLHSNILNEFLSAPKSRQFHEQNTSKFYRLEWNYSTDPDDTTTTQELFASISSWKNILEPMQRVFAFVADHILLSRANACTCVGDLFFGKPKNLSPYLMAGGEESLGLEPLRLGQDDHGLLLTALIELLETTCVPKAFIQPDPGKHLQETAEELAEYLNPFVKILNSKQLLGSYGENRLMSFTTSLEQKYIDQRRCDILNEARNLLLDNDYHNAVIVGEDVLKNPIDEALGITDGMAIFKLHKASISDTTCKLMAMCRQVMDQAVMAALQHSLSSEETHHSVLSVLPGTLYRTAREILDLFRAIIPVKLGHEISNVPRTAAIFHNDTVYLAYHCLTLGLEYKEKFPELNKGDNDDLRGSALLRQTCMFVDMVPLFRDLADRSLGDMLELQARQFSHIVGERITLMGEALRSEEALAEWSDAETALTAGIYHIRRLHQTWKPPMLSHEIYNKSIGYLVDVMLDLFLDQIFAKSVTDISTGACQFVHSLFQTATHDLEALSVDVKSFSRVWDRFWAVGAFMDMSLSDIHVALSDGKFRSLTGAELSRLLVSCFDESPKRAALLKMLMASS
jgi:centromere/kinetochore protein ZW10